jgi:hypothetical protein
LLAWYRTKEGQWLRDANLLLLRADPSETVEAYSGIAKVILGGRALDPSNLAPDHAR